MIYNKDNFENNYNPSLSLKKEYITVGALAGLNNRIQVILSYLYQARNEGKKLKVVWIIDEQCPGKFDDLFEPIDNVTILYDEINDSLYDYKNWDKSNMDYINKNYYALLKPKVNIQVNIDDMKQLLSFNSKDYISCHIRRTDALTHKWYKLHVKSDDEYISFINSCPINNKIYIATDCKLTQQKFVSIYGDRIIYKQIQDTIDLRQTSLEDAVKDIYICAGAKYFMRSYGSFSDTIEYIKNLHIEKYTDILPYQIDGDEIYQNAINIKNAENSRFNYKTKECSHWYSKEIVNNILSSPNKYTNILILGVALGGQIIHLLDKDPNMKVTGVDISDINFDIVKKYSDNKRLRLIKDDANNYINTTNDKYDVIICDVFIGMNVADFVLTNDFLDKINIMLLYPNSKFLLNTTTSIDKNMVVSLLKKSFNYYEIDIINNPKYVNNLYFLTKT
jgi:hypothetical protein